MKKYLLMFMTAIIFLSALTAIKTAAQTLKVVRAEVPFDFRVGDQIYPAGTYILETISRQSDNLLRLRGFDRTKPRLLTTNSVFANRWQIPKLVFYRIGEEHHLANIFMEDATGDTRFVCRGKLKRRETGFDKDGRNSGEGLKGSRGEKEKMRLVFRCRS